MSDLKKGSRVEIKGGASNGATGVVDRVDELGAWVLLDEHEPTPVYFTFASHQLWRVMDIPREFGTDVAPQLAAIRANNEKAIAALREIQAREDAGVGGAIVELVPELVELLGMAAQLPAPVRVIVERIAVKLAKMALE